MTMRAASASHSPAMVRARRCDRPIAGWEAAKDMNKIRTQLTSNCQASKADRDQVESPEAIHIA